MQHIKHACMHEQQPAQRYWSILHEHTVVQYTTSVLSKLY